MAFPVFSQLASNDGGMEGRTSGGVTWDPHLGSWDEKKQVERDCMSWAYLKRIMADQELHLASPMSNRTPTHRRTEHPVNLLP
jgi:hypothetical protein